MAEPSDTFDEGDLIARAKAGYDVANRFRGEVVSLASDLARCPLGHNRQVPRVAPD